MACTASSLLYRSPLGRRVLVLVGLTCVSVALTGCPTVDLGDEPVPPGSCRPSPAYFEEVIWPEVINSPDIEASCVGDSGCHRREDGRSALRFSVVEPIDQRANYEVVTRFLNCGSPLSSSFLTKPLSGIDSHGGGDLFDIGSPQEIAFTNWFGTP